MSIYPKITAMSIAKATASASYDCATYAVTSSYKGLKNTAGRVGSTSLGVIQYAGSFFTCGKKAAPSPKALSHSVSALAKFSSARNEAENFDQLLQVIGLPENIQNVFKTGLIPPGSLRKCEFGNGSFNLELDRDYQGKVTGVDPKKGMGKLNNVNVFVSQKITGNYDPATRSLSSIKGISAGVTKLFSIGLNEFGMKADPTPKSEMIIKTTMYNKECSVSKFQNTLSSEYLKWEQEKK